MVDPARRLMAASKGGGLRARLLRGGVGSLMLKLSNRALTLLVAIALARTLGPGGYGVYSFALAIITLIMVPVRLGLPMLVMRETASASAQGRLATIGALWRWSTRLVLVLSAIVLAVGSLALWASQDWMDETHLYTFAIGLPVVLVTGLSRLRSASLKGLHRVVLAQTPEMLVRPSLILAGVGTVITLGAGSWLGPAHAMALNVMAAAGAFLVGAVLLRRHRPAGIHAVKPESDQIRNWISAILPLAFLSGVQVINKNTDIAMLGLLGTDSQVGVYRVAMQGGLLVIFGSQALNQVFMPYFSSVRAQGDSARLQRLVAVGGYATTATALLFAIVFWLFGREIIETAFGAEYAGAYAPLGILAAGQVFSASMGQVGALLSMTGHERHTLRGFLAAFGLNIILNVALIPYLGAVGAATATSLSLVMLNVLLWVSVRRRLGIDASVVGNIYRTTRRSVSPLS